MAFSNRFTGSFVGHNKIEYSITLYSELGTATAADFPTITADGVNISWEGGEADDPMYPIVASSCDLSVITDSELFLSNMRTFVEGNPEQTYIHIEDSTNGQSWYGHFLPEELTYEIVDGQTQVEMAFSDGLSLLKNYDFAVDTSLDFYTQANETDGEFYKSGRTAVSMITTILSKIPWFSEAYTAAAGADVLVRETPLLQHKAIDTDADPATQEHEALLPTLLIQPNAFADEKDEENRRKTSRVRSIRKFANCYDVLGDILETTGSKICWNGFEWHIYSPLAYGLSVNTTVSGIKTFTYTKTNFTSNPGGRISPATDWVDTYDLDTYYALETGASITFTPGNSRYLGTHEKGGAYYLHRRDPFKTGNEWNPAATYNKYRDPNGNTASFQNNYDGFNFRSSNEYAVLPAGERATFSFKTQMKWKKQDFNRNDPAAVAIPLLAIRFEVGTESHADPYILDGRVEKLSTAVNFNKGISGNVDQYCLGTDSLSDIEWQRISTHPGDSTLGGINDGKGTVYIPLFWDGAAYSNKAPWVTKTVGGVSVKFVGSLHQTKDGDEFRFNDQDTINDVEITFEFPAFPDDMIGYDLKVGLAAMDGLTSTNECYVDTIYDYVNTAYTSPDSASNTIQDALFGENNDDGSTEGVSMEYFYLKHLRLSMGDSTSANRNFYANPASYDDEVKLLNTRVATSPSGTYADNVLMLHNDWTTQPLDNDGAGTSYWSTGDYWYTVEGDLFSESVNTNLSVILYEFASRFSNGIYTIDASLAPWHSQTHTSFITPDKALYTSDVVSGNATLVADSMAWSSTSGASITGIVYDRSRDPITDYTGDEVKGDLSTGSGGGGAPNPVRPDTVPVSSVGGIGAGTTDGEVLKWDTGTEGWVVTGEDSVSVWDGKQEALPVPVDQGDMLYWDNSLKEWVLSASDAISKLGYAHSNVFNAITAYSATDLTEILDGKPSATDATVDFTSGDLSVTDAAGESTFTVSGTAAGGKGATILLDADLATNSTNTAQIDTKLASGTDYSVFKTTESATTVTARGTGATLWLEADKVAGSGTTILEGVWNGTYVWTKFGLKNAAGTVIYELPTADGTAGQVMTTDGAGTVSWGDVTLDGLSDTTLSSLTAGDWLYYSGATWGKLSAATAAAVMLSNGNIANLGDVTVTTPSNGQVLEYQSGTWVNATPSGGSPTLDDVTTNGNTTPNTIEVGGVTSTQSSASNLFSIESTESGPGFWTALSIYRDSASPADSDNIGAIDFDGNHSGAAQHTYARITASTVDVTNATEEGKLSLGVSIGGAIENAIEIGDTTYTAGGSTTINNLSGSNALVLWNAQNSATLALTFDADTKTTASNAASINYIDGAGDTRNVMRMEDGKTILNNRTASSSVELRANNGTAGSGGEEILLQADTTNGITINEEYSLPLLDSTAGAEVMWSDAAGDVRWGTKLTFSNVGLFQMTTSNDQMYRWCTSTTYPNYGNWSKATATVPTSVTTDFANYWRKGGHFITQDGNDSTIKVRGWASISGSASSAVNVSSHNSTTYTFNVYRARQTSGNICTVTQLGADTITFNGSDTNTPQPISLNLTGESLLEGDIIAIVGKGSTNVTATRYLLLDYTLDVALGDS